MPRIDRTKNKLTPRHVILAYKRMTGRIVTIEQAAPFFRLLFSPAALSDVLQGHEIHRCYACSGYFSRTEITPAALTGRRGSRELVSICPGCCPQDDQTQKAQQRRTV